MYARSESIQDTSEHSNNKIEQLNLSKIKANDGKDEQ